VLVDNGSSDGTQAMVREIFSQVRLVQNDHNVGLSAASNQGIESTHGRHVLLLNDDTLVNAPSLDGLVDFMDAHPDAGAVGGKLLNPDGTFQAGYARFSSLLQEFLIASRLSLLISPNYPSHGNSDQVREADWLSSACLLLRRAALNQVGLLIQDYFIYGDEADLQYRMKRAGWKVYYLPEATTIHFGGRSLNRWRRRKMVYRGKMLFYRKNYGAYYTGAMRTMMGVISLAKLMAWTPAVLLPRWQQRAHQELSSNLDVLRLCWKLE
jgi:N-acetylglucosaminyl-diphospho-decaprenol L-rhamnosyltransferase